MNLKDVKTHDSALKKLRRVGRGQGSGKGCTAGRGNNGQGSRSGSGGGLAFMGGQMPLARQLPKRGFTNALFKVTHAIVNVGDLAKAFPEGGVVDLETAKETRLVKHKAGSLKVLGKGEVAVALQVRAHRASKSAVEKIEAAGGSVEFIVEKTAAERAAEKRGSRRQKRLALQASDDGNVASTPEKPRPVSSSEVGEVEDEPAVQESSDVVEEGIESVEEPAAEEPTEEIPEPAEEPTEESPEAAEEPAEESPEPAEEPAEEPPELADEPAVETPEPADEPAEETPEPADEPAEETPEPAEAPAEETPAGEAPAEETPEPADEPAEETPEPAEEPAEDGGDPDSSIDDADGADDVKTPSPEDGDSDENHDEPEEPLSP